jgi:Tol biopolymer transport system component
MRLDNVVRETIHDLAGSVRPAQLGPGALALGRRMRRRRVTAVVASSMAVLAVAVAAPVALWPRGDGTGPVGAADGYFAGKLGEAGDALDVAISPDGEIIAAAGGNSHSVVLWSARSGEQLRVLTGDTVVSAVAFSPDGTLLATGSDIWNPRTGERLHSFAGGAYDVAFSPDGKTIATANGFLPNGVRLFGTSSGTLTRTVTEEYASRLAFSPDGTLLATLGLQDGAALWRVDTGEKVRTLAGTWARAEFSPDGQLVATSGDIFFDIDGGAGSTAGDVVQFWNPVTGEPVRELQAVAGFGFSPDGTLFAGADESGRVELFDAATGNLIRTLSDVRARALVFSPDGQRLLIVEPDGRVRVVPVS